MRPIAWWGGLSRRRRLLVTFLALVVVAGGVDGTARALAGSPAVTSANQNHPGAVLLVPG